MAPLQRIKSLAKSFQASDPDYRIKIFPPSFNHWDNRVPFKGYRESDGHRVGLNSGGILAYSRIEAEA